MTTGATALWGDLRKAWQLVRWQRLLKRRDSKRTPVRILIAVVFGLFFMISIGAGSVSPLVALRGNQSAMDGFVMLASILAGAFLLYIQLIVTYQRLIVEDTSILLAAPITGRAILLFRLFENLTTALLFCALGLPMLCVYLWLSSAPYIAYPVAVIALFLGMFFIISLSLFLMAIVLRLIRRPISRDMLGVISTIVAIGILLGTRVLSHHLENTPSSVLGKEMFSTWLTPGVAYVPLAWLGHSLMGFAHHSPVGVAYMLLELIGIVLVVRLAILVSGNILHERLTQLSDVATTKPHRGQRGRQAWRRSRSESTTRVAAQYSNRRLRLMWEITRKDLLRLRRTPVDLASYLFPTAYLLYFITQPRNSGGMGPMVGLLPVFILILASTMGRVPISSFGTEGEQVWLYLQAPMPGNTVLFAKWLFGTLPTLLWWEVLCVLLTLFHALSPMLAVLLGISGLWLIPGAVALTMPFAIHGAAFIPRLVGRRNRYVNGRSAWYILVIFPYLLLQMIPLGAVSLVLVPPVSVNGRLGSFLLQLQHISWLIVVGLIVSLALSGLAMMIGRSMGLEAWRNKRIELYETGSLDGNG